MPRFKLPSLPENLDDLCAAYDHATGSYAWRLADRMLRFFRDAPLSAVEPRHATSFLRLRATVLNSLGDVSACRAIFKFAATQASGSGDIVAQAAALAELHVDRSLRLDDDTEHGSPFIGAIRDDLLDIVKLLEQNPDAMAENPDLATATLAHLTHGFALIGAIDDGRAVLDQAHVICPDKQSLKASLDLADAVLLACSGEIEEACEFGELILGRESEDPLALQVEVRQFLGTWYRALDRHEEAAAHLKVVTELCQDHGLTYLSVVGAMQQISSLVELNQSEAVIELASWALDEAAEIGINNEVVRTLDVVLVQSLSALDRHLQALNCAEIAGTRSREHGDVSTALTLYEMGAKSARLIDDPVRAANLYGFCAELSGGMATIQARFLRKEAEAVLATVGIQAGKTQVDTASIETRTALSLTTDLMDEALTLLMSTPAEQRELGAQELSKWNALRAWISSVSTQPNATTSEESDV